MKRHGRIAIVGKRGILLVAKENHPFNLPGGKSKKGEPPHKTARRETQEELGKGVRLSRLLFHSDHYLLKTGKGTRREMHRVYTANLHEKSKHAPSKEIHEMRWVNPKNIPRTRLAFPANYVVQHIFARAAAKKK